jgi:hypothetical protein
MAAATQSCPCLILVGAFGVVALMARAHGSIVYQDIPDIHMAHNAMSGDLSSYLDLDFNGTNDFRFELTWNDASEGQTHTQVSSLGSLPGVVDRGAFGTQFPTTGAEALAAGFSIQPSLPAPPPNNTRSWSPNSQLADTNVSVTDHGWWNGAAYLGVRFAEADGNHYGWISMSATSSSIDIYSFAYETTPDAPILAGAVPSPGAGGAILMAAAGLGVRRARRARGV